MFDARLVKRRAPVSRSGACDSAQVGTARGSGEGGKDERQTSLVTVQVIDVQACESTFSKEPPSLFIESSDGGS